ncbi:hypothetical protein vB_Efae230P-4.24 [Enterococcus phage vB_Efae230P-4]|uniref:Uncharacterized protein n=1 Tax=Enterococcus phage vB_Efae230P-4 TaxID=1161939 RepID=A0A067XH32_9CAUD|nr:hypothetical protein vB_Efae230P-4.24 [Enterococcus phage vB_Efae230P-4]AFF27956.1 hypothetical protein vB_Efae230P-4.24 [Enterococcus phage vB_Efae230P-4]
MQEFKVGDLVEVIKNPSCARNNFNEYYKKGDKEIVTGVGKYYINIGNNMTANVVSREDIKKVDPTPELTEYEEELVLILAEYIHHKNTCLSQIQKFKNNIKFNEN